MFKNYVTVALRNILKHKLFSFINIAGLMVGMACCLMIFVYVQDELSYDRFHKDAEQIYRVALHGRIGGQEVHTSNSSLPVGPALRSEVPGVESFIRLRKAAYGSGYAIRFEDKAFTEERVLYSDSNFFNFFSFPLLQGDPRTALREPNSIVVTEALARKYFGTTDVLGKTLVVGNDKFAAKVTGVAAEAPSNSHIYYNALVSISTIEKTQYAGWGGNSWLTYIRVAPGTSISGIDARLDELVEKHMGKELEEGMGISFSEFKKQGGIYSYFLYPMIDTHLYTSFPDGLEPNNTIENVYIFSGVGLFILVIACINFMNLSTARSAGRAKEVGLRKTLGSKRAQMIGQFLSESFIYSAVALVGALAISYLMLPSFNLLAGKQLTLSALSGIPFVAAAASLLIVVGFLAGSYPAFYMTSFSAVEVLKGKVRAGLQSKGIRSSLVVFQFAVSTFLIIATVIVFQQLDFMQAKNLGMDKQNVITVTGARRLGTSAMSFKNAVTAIPGVVGASYTDNSFPGINNTNLFREKNKEVDHLLASYSTDWDHLATFRMSLTQGRFFSRENVADTLSCVINEAAVREYGFDDPIGKEITDFSEDKPRNVRVIGVVKDFNFESIKENIRPLVIQLQETGRELTVRYQGDPRQVVASLEKQWRAMAPGEPFEYTFLDQEYDALFRSEVRLRDIFTVFSLLAIVIACLGLFALAAFTTEQRTKEIGVRKAMGASVFSLTFLISKEFTRLVIIAIVPAIGAGWYVSSWWLSTFSYRMTPTPVLFVVCGLTAIAIAWITVSYQAVKAASAEPVKSLRYE